MSARKERFLTPAKTSLLMVAIGAIALIGVPGIDEKGVGVAFCASHHLA